MALSAVSVHRLPDPRRRTRCHRIQAYLRISLALLKTHRPSDPELLIVTMMQGRGRMQLAVRVRGNSVEHMFCLESLGAEHREEQSDDATATLIMSEDGQDVLIPR